MRILSVASSTPVMRLSYFALNSSMKPVDPARLAAVIEAPAR